MNIKLRTERPSDYKFTEGVVKDAFANMEISDKTEHLMVARLRQADSFIPELSIVAEYNNSIVAHVLLTPVLVKQNTSSKTILALAPISVLPQFQNQGIGAQLMQHCHIVAIRLGFSAIALIGHEKYYPRFGYVKAIDFNISFPFDVPDNNAMIKILNPTAFDTIAGRIEYPKAFFE